MDNQSLQRKLKQLFPDADKRGRVKSALLGLSDRELDFVFSDDDEAVKVTLEHRLAASPGGGAGAGALAGLVTRDDLVQILQPIQEEVHQVTQMLPPLQTVVVSLVADGYQAPGSSTSNVSQRFRQESLVKYDAIGTNNNTWCTFTGMWWPQFAVESVERNRVVTYVRNGHILGCKTRVSDWVPLGLGPSIDVLENVVPMMAAVESAFDKNRICVIPEKDGMGGIAFVIYVLDPELLPTVIYQQFKNSNQRPHQSWTDPLPELQHRPGLGTVLASELTFGQLDRLPLAFRGDRRPARRCFTQHAFYALYWARQKEWHVPDVQIDMEHFGWTSPQVEDRLRGTAIWLAMQREAQAADESIDSEEAQV